MTVVVVPFSEPRRQASAARVAAAPARPDEKPPSVREPATREESHEDHEPQHEPGYGHGV